jgi:hypothetical protein
MVKRAMVCVSRVLSVVLLCAVVTGCAHHPGGVAASSTPIEGRRYRVLGHAEGTDSHVLLFGLIPIKGSNSTRTAMDRAVRSRGGDALIDVTVETYTQWWIILIRRAVKVEGMAIRFESTPASR